MDSSKNRVSMMLTSFLRLCLWLTLSFVVLLALIQTQPYDDADLRAFFALTERCPSVCLLGLRPDVTLMDSAIRGLDRNGWVTDLTNRVRGGTGDLSWRWSSDAPAVIDPTHFGRVWISGGVVQTITIDLRDSVGALRLVMDDRSAASLSATWQVTPLRACPLALATYWNAPARVQLITRSAIQQPVSAFAVWACVIRT